MIIKGISMECDMDLIRAILLAVEAHPHGYAPPMLEISGYTEEQIGYHAFILGEAGLAKVSDVTTLGSESPRAVIISLTWAGHQFLASARENQIWNQAKDLVKKIGDASIEIWMVILTDLIKKKLGL